MGERKGGVSPMGEDEGYRSLASSDAQEMPERNKTVEKCGKKSKKSRRMILLCTAAVLLIAAAELAVLFAYFLPSPFPCRALRFDADEVTEILLVRERREQTQGIFQTVYDYARVTDPDAIAALTGSLGAISLREESGRRWTDLETDDRMGGPYYVRVTAVDGTAQRFAFGAPGLLLLESAVPSPPKSGSPFSIAAILPRSLRWWTLILRNIPRGFRRRNAKIAGLRSI